MSEGFITLQRKFFKSWEWYSDLPTRVLFIHCIYRANWKDQRFLGQVIPRGSFVTTVRNLAEETGLTIKQVRRAIDNLQSTEELRTVRANKGQLVTVVNYSLYQDKNTEQGKQKTNEGQTKGTDRNNINNKINNIPPIIPQNVWNDYYEYRKKSCGKKFTDNAQQLAIKKLESLAQEGNDPKAVVEQSILNGWKGLFAIKGVERNGTNRNIGTSGSSKAERARAAIAASNEGLV